MSARERISTAEWCRGRWPWLLNQFGIDEKHLTNHHGPCPLCGGDDRFRFDDKEDRGTWICNSCGAGDGFDLLMKYTGREFKDLAAQIVKDHMKFAPAPNQRTSFTERRDEANKRAALNTAWRMAKNPLLVEQYLKHRGLTRLADVCDLRGNMECLFVDKDVRDKLPAMLALVRDIKSNDPVTVHRTYLLPNGSRIKKMMSPASKMVAGYQAVKLVSIRNGTLVVAEGIETALAGRELVTRPGQVDVGVWAAVSANNMAELQIPKEVEHVVICADADVSFTGEWAAFQLARKCSMAGKHVDVIVPEQRGQDMVDALTGPHPVRQVKNR